MSKRVLEVRKGDVLVAQFDRQKGVAEFLNCATSTISNKVTRGELCQGYSISWVSKDIAIMVFYKDEHLYTVNSIEEAGRVSSIEVSKIIPLIKNGHSIKNWSFDEELPVKKTRKK